jgi:hypothetical protein
MKKALVIVAVLMAIGIVSNNAYSQIGNVKDLKDKAGSVSSGKNKNAENKEEKSATVKDEKKDPSNSSASGGLESGKGSFFTSFKPKGFKNEVGIGEELFVRMNLGKTMIEHADAAGFSSSHSAYGFVTVYIDDKKCFVNGPISFASNISKQWKYIDIPLNVSPDFVSKIAADQSMLETAQDIWMFQQLFQEKSIPNQYTSSAIKQMNSATHTVKVEFGLGESSSEEPKIVVCTGIVKVNVDAAGAENLAMSGPKHLRPLKEEEKGKFIFNTNTFVPGTGELNVKLQLPQPAKYYNEKWCKATTCDYDHGSMLFYVSIDGMPVTHWESDLWKEDYEKVKEFSLIILPVNDAGYGDMGAAYNKNKLYKGSSPVVYALLDMLYGGIIKQGNHKLTIKAYSQECVPYDVSYELAHSYFSQWPSIAETTIEFNVTNDGLNKLVNSSSAKKLSHAGGEWTAIDNKLKATNTGIPGMEILDVACKTEWKVTTNSLGAILYRECKADVLYKCEYGYRIQEGVAVKTDYAGGAYGSPYFNERIAADHGPSLLGTMHEPVPLIKVK